MAWGSSKASSSPSTVSQLLPLLITLAIVAAFAWLGYQIYLSVTKISQQASQRMASKNVAFTKDGLRVGVKDMKNENYVDATQSYVVKAWNLAGQEKKEEAERKKGKKTR